MPSSHTVDLTGLQRLIASYFLFYYSALFTSGTMGRMRSMTTIFLLWLRNYPCLLAHPFSANFPLSFNTSDLPTVLQERDEIGWQPNYVLHITYEPIALSCFEQGKVLINGQHPAPLLRFQEGQTTWVRVYNHLERSAEVLNPGIAIHWHGIDVQNHHDGTPETQYLVHPGYFRDYKITPPLGSAGISLYLRSSRSFRVPF